jgi:uncharacterized metal-binding protein
MDSLPKLKVGIVSCSGEELPEGTVSRLAALRVLHELRPHETVTLCLPLFLAGGESERAFARVHPTITVDGCDLRCAARATAMYSAEPAASVVVNDLVAERGLGKPEGRRRLNEAGRQAVDATATHVAALVDELLDRTTGTATSGERVSGK